MFIPKRIKAIQKPVKRKGYDFLFTKSSMDLLQINMSFRQLRFDV